MIVGHGIDLQEMGRLSEILANKPSFASKVLTPAELEQFQSYPERRALSFLAGRWAGKEAFAKAYGTGLVAGVGFQDLEILSDKQGRPIFTRSPFPGRVWVSISHSGGFAQASVILEEVTHDSQPSSPDLGDHQSQSD